MANTLKLDGHDYLLEDLSQSAKKQLASLKFINERINELNNIVILLQRAKDSYIRDIKSEIIANKSGFLLD